MKRKILVNLVVALCLSIMSISTMHVFAQTGGGGGTTQNGGGSGTSQGPITATIPNPLSINCAAGPDKCNLFDFINALVDKAVLPIGGIVVVIAFIFSGFKFVTAQGDEGKIAEARRALTYCAIGATILLGAKVISAVISATINSVQNASS